MNDRPWLWPALVVVSATAAMGSVMLDWDHPIRSVAVLWFLCVCPGLAVLHPLELPDPVTGLALIVPLSLAIDAIVAGAVLYVGLWSTTLALACVVALSLVALFGGGILVERRRTDGEVHGEAPRPPGEGSLPT